jgi:transcriptional regulator with XRE-family HTH domain
MPRAKRSPGPDGAAESVGRRIRELRNQRRLTLADLGERTGLSLPFLSRLERGAATMTIANLVRITAALAVPLKDMFEDGPRPARLALSRAGDAGAEPLAASGYSYRRLAAGMPDASAEAFELEFPVTSSPIVPLVRHAGEEVLYVLSGRIEFQVGEERFEMRAGDCLHFDAEQPHMGRNLGRAPARMLMVVTNHRSATGAVRTGGPEELSQLAARENALARPRILKGGKS